MGLFFDGGFECSSARNLAYFFYCVFDEAVFIPFLYRVCCECTRACIEELAWLLLLLIYRTAVAKNYVTYWSGPNTAGKAAPPRPPGLRELSVVPEMGAARHVLSLQREPHLTLISTDCIHPCSQSFSRGSFSRAMESKQVLRYCNSK